MDEELQLLSDYSDGNLDHLIPQLARDRQAIARIESVVQCLKTNHDLIVGDSRAASALPDRSIHLVVTSPPYWTLKRYNEHVEQLGHLGDYDEFIAGSMSSGRTVIDRSCPVAAWSLMSGTCACRVGRIMAGTPLCRSTRQSRSVARRLASIISPQSSGTRLRARTTKSRGGGGFLGKPYEPNAVIKNDIEFVLMQRKPGGYRSPARRERLLSVISGENYQRWFRQIWTDIRGTSNPKHPAPFPVEFAERLIRMFSFVGDTVLDPFMGTGTTNLACARWGRNSIGVELDATYFDVCRSGSPSTGPTCTSHRR